MYAVLAFALLAAAPGPSPSPSASPGAALKTIATVKSTPYCSSIAEHFNGAAAPMVANDETLARVNVGLESLSAIFASPDYAQQFVQWRVALTESVAQLEKRLAGEQEQINELRKSETLTNDPAEAQSAHMVAEKMQEAYDHQMQLATDLQGVVQGSEDYDIMDRDHPLLGETQESLAEPAEMKDLKSYLKFDGQRDVIARSESAAGDIAYDIVTTHCLQP